MNRMYYSLGVALLFAACANENRIGECTVPTVADGLVHLDGENSEAAWSAAARITTFSNPWNAAVHPPTRLSLALDSRYLYFFFEAEDPELLLETDFSTERDVEKEDRIELFFSKDKEMTEYYGFEIDPAGRTLAYRCHHYRQFHFDWDPPADFAATGKVNIGGYTVEGAIPIHFLAGLQNADGSLYFGAYRAEFSKNADGTTIENWLTWIDPQTAEPDFHVPQSLGKMRGLRLYFL